VIGERILRPDGTWDELDHIDQQLRGCLFEITVVEQYVWDGIRRWMPGYNYHKERAKLEQRRRPAVGINKDLLKQGAELLLRGMGLSDEELQDSNFKDTPARVAKMYAELLTPQENNWQTFPAPSKGMIVLRKHTIFALCPHHLLPVELRAYVAYIPSERVLGLSKLARVVEQHLTLPIMQEELGDKVADSLMSRLQPQGVAVVLAGEHGCMRIRGVETTGDVVTSALRGLFLHAAQTRDEFYRIIGPIV
jgi:GTP cyclohydrolase I